LWNLNTNQFILCSVTSAKASSETPADWARPRLERQIDRLDELAEIGMEMARDLGRQVKAATRDGGVGAEASERAYLAFSRVSRAVRLTLMLQARFITALEDRDRGVQPAPQRPVEYTVRRIIVDPRAPEGEDRPDRLGAEAGERLAAERLDQDDLHGDVLTQPSSALISRIRQDLGLDPDGPIPAQEASAREEIETGNTGWPPTPPSAPRPGPPSGSRPASAATPRLRAGLP
jgi:hypothetical protein